MRGNQDSNLGCHGLNVKYKPLYGYREVGKRGWFRTGDLDVMGPVRFRCATLSRLSIIILFLIIWLETMNSYQTIFLMKARFKLSKLV